jgi:hypothetical protein
MIRYYGHFEHLHLKGLKNPEYVASKLPQPESTQNRTKYYLETSIHNYSE